MSYSEENGQVATRLLAELDLAEQKAWDSLSRYKFQMFGYWAAIWVHLNRVSGARRKNPWRELVEIARQNDSRPRDYVKAFDELNGCYSVEERKP